MTNISNDKYNKIRLLLLIIGIIAVVGKAFCLINDEKSILSFFVGVLFIIIAILSYCKLKIELEEMKELKKIEKFSLIMEIGFGCIYFGIDGLCNVLVFLT